MDHVFENAEKVSKVAITVRVYDADGEIPLIAYTKGMDLYGCSSVWEKVKRLQDLVCAAYRTLQYLVGVNIKEPHSTVNFNTPRRENLDDKDIART